MSGYAKEESWDCIQIGRFFRLSTRYTETLMPLYYTVVHSLPKISPCSLGVGGWPLAFGQRRAKGLG